MSLPARWGDMDSPVKPANDAKGADGCPHDPVTPAKAGVQGGPSAGFQLSLE